MANLELLCEELKNCGIPCSVVQADEYPCDELSFAHGGFEKKSDNEPVKNHECEKVLNSAVCEVSALYGIHSPFIRADINNIKEKEAEMAAEIHEIVERHAGNRGLKLKAGVAKPL